MNCPICKKELEIKNKKVGESATGEIIFNEFAICHDCKKQWNLDKQRAKRNAAKVQADAPAKQEVEVPVAPESPVQTGEKPPVRKVKKKRPVNPDTVTDVAANVSSDAAPAPKKKRPAPEGELQNRPKKKKRPANLEATIERVTAADSEIAPVPKKRRPAPEGELQDRPKKRKRPVTNIDDELAGLSTPSIEEEIKEKTYSNIPPKHVREAREKELRQNYQNMLDEDDEDEGSSPIILILIIIILLLAVAAFAGYWFFLR